MRRLTALAVLATVAVAAILIAMQRRDPWRLALDDESDATGDLSASSFVDITADGRVVELDDDDDVTEDWLLDAVIASVIADHPDRAAAFRAGEGVALGFLLGQVLRAVEGRVDVVEAAARLRGQLEAVPDRPAVIAPIGEVRPRRGITDGDDDWENPILPGELPGRSGSLERPTDEEPAEEPVADVVPAAGRRRRAAKTA